MDTVDQRLCKHWAVVRRVRRDADLARREDTIHRHLRRWYSNSEEFLEQLNSILVEAALATEPCLKRKLGLLHAEAAKRLKNFMAGHPTVAPNGNEQPHIDGQQEQRETVNERPLAQAQEATSFQQEINDQNEQTGQKNLEEPNSHSSLMNVSSEILSTTDEYHQCRKRKAQCLDHAVSDLLLKAALGETILNDSPDSAGAAKLRHVLGLMQVGRFRRAIEDITGCWNMDDCQVIVKYGVAIFQQQKIDEDSGYMSFVKYFGRLTREGIHERFIDLARQVDLMKNLALPDKSAPKCWISLLPAPDADHSLEALYDPVFINQWFYWMNSPYMVTAKLLVKDNVDEQNRAQHLAYLVCYWNSYDTRRLMGKLEAEDAPDSSETPVAFDLDNGPWHRRRQLTSGGTQDRSRPEKKPISFLQTNSGQCCTLALFNFLANQEPRSQSEIVKTILRRAYTCSDEVKYDLYAADQDISLRTLHYWLLSDRDIDQHGEEQGLDDIEDHDSSQPSGNHMVIIMPFAGYVWEIDSYHADSPLCLGAEGGDWKHVAQERLQMWTDAAIESRVCNDVHAIVRE